MSRTTRVRLAFGGLALLWLIPLSQPGVAAIVVVLGYLVETQR